VALWQFVTLTVLIGALLVYARVIARRLACIDARLNKIEEALRAKSRSIDSVDARAAEAKPEVSGGQEGRESHLTIRDLRQLSSHAPRVNTRNSTSGSERHDTSTTARGPMKSPSANPERGRSDCLPTSLESRDDSVAKKNRDMTLFLSNQRRRRRARLGY
jgi:hypothetical protein